MLGNYQNPPSLVRRAVCAWVIIGMVVTALGGCKKDPEPLPPPPASSQSATGPATTRAAASKPNFPGKFIDVVRLDYPDCPTTQPLDLAVSLKEAAHVILREPVMLDARSDLWITRPDAAPTLDVLKAAPDEQTHITREIVRFVHWRVEGGRVSPVLIVDDQAGAQPQMLALDHRGKAVTRLPLGTMARRYVWPSAFSWGDAIVVPTRDSVVMFEHDDGDGWKEMASASLLDDARSDAAVETTVDFQGVYGWIPPHGTQPGGKTVVRFKDGRWSTLGPDNTWPANLIHMVPLADGSVLQIADDSPGKVRMSLTGHVEAQVDEKLIKHLIYELSDDEQEKRDAAYAKLQTYGGGIWSLLEKALPNNRGEAKARIETLLRNKTDPTLGSMTPLSNRLKVVARAADGGVLCYCEAGVSMPVGEADETQTVTPAWLSIRPGQAVQLMAGDAWKQIDPEHYQFYSIGNRWIVSDEARGPREFVGTYDLQPILPKSERDFSEVIGADRRGRMLFRRPAKPASAPTVPVRAGSATTHAATRATTASVATTTAASQPVVETLVIDPTIPSMTPHLPVWDLTITGGKAGWDRDNYPAFKDAGGKEWVIRESGFQLLDKKRDAFLSTPAEIPAFPPFAAVGSPATESHASSRPSTSTGLTTTPTTSSPITSSPATRPATQPRFVETTPPILVDSTGTRYYGGQTSLRIVTVRGEETDWELPARATGTGKVGLVRDSAGRLFLFNEPGRVVRLKPSPGDSQPFSVDATFARKIPNVDEPTRIWLDPANRIVMVYGENQFAILFPAGHVPKEIADKMPPDVDEDSMD